MMGFFSNISNAISEYKIPTVLGIGIITLGIGAGVFLVSQNQSLTTSASPNQAPQHITLSNIQDKSIAISWETLESTPGYVTFGIQSADEITTIDDRDSQSVVPRREHYVTLKNLSPNTTYKYKIFSGQSAPHSGEFTTTSSSTTENQLKAVIATVVKDNSPLKDGIAYVLIPGVSIQSAPIRSLGNFVIPLSHARNEDLSDIAQIDPSETGDIVVISNGQEASAKFSLSNLGTPLGQLRIGENLDLTNLSPQQPTVAELNKFDLNNDGLINSSDHSIVLTNFGSNPKEKKADFNADNIVNQTDLDFIAQYMREHDIPISSTPTPLPTNQPRN